MAVSWERTKNGSHVWSSFLEMCFSLIEVDEIIRRVPIFTVSRYVYWSKQLDKRRKHVFPHSVSWNKDLIHLRGAREGVCQIRSLSSHMYRWLCCIVIIKQPTASNNLYSDWNNLGSNTSMLPTTTLIWSASWARLIATKQPYNDTTKTDFWYRVAETWRRLLRFNKLILK